MQILKHAYTYVATYLPLFFIVGLLSCSGSIPLEWRYPSSDSETGLVTSWESKEYTLLSVSQILLDIYMWPDLQKPAFVEIHILTSLCSGCLNLCYATISSLYYEKFPSYKGR